MKRIKFKELIIQETDNYIIINKPAYISSLEDRDKTRDTIKAMAQHYHSDAQLCHRLDKETSGVLAIAKNPKAYRHLALQFEKRKVTKIYHAVVSGVHDIQGILVNLPIKVLRKGNVCIDKLEGKPAETVFNSLRAFREHTLVECRPITGRMHQIRIHLSCLKAPIIADTAYGGKMFYLSELKKKRFNLKKDTEEQPLIKRVALHAHTLIFEDLDQKPLEATASYPKDIRALTHQLNQYS